MKEKLSFNQTGILTIQKTLHALPNPKLSIEVAALRLDFKKWINSKFNLTPEEQSFLNNLNEHLTSLFAIKVSNLLALRKHINLTVIDLTPDPQN